MGGPGRLYPSGDQVFTRFKWSCESPRADDNDDDDDVDDDDVDDDDCSWILSYT